MNRNRRWRSLIAFAVAVVTLAAVASSSAVSRAAILHRPYPFATHPFPVGSAHLCKVKGRILVDRRSIDAVLCVGRTTEIVCEPVAKSMRLGSAPAALPIRCRGIS